MKLQYCKNKYITKTEGNINKRGTKLSKLAIKKSKILQLDS